MNESMIVIVNMLKIKNEEKKPATVKKSSTLSLSDLNSLYNKHVSHMSFFKDNELLTEEKKEILRNIEEVYILITNKRSNNKRNREDDDETEVIVTNYNSNVS